MHFRSGIAGRMKNGIGTNGTELPMTVVGGI